MVTAIKIKKGYKQTELGVIPEDWEVQELRHLTILITNGFVGTATIHYTDSDNGITYIQGFNVEANSFNFTGIKKVTHSFHKQHQRSCLREGDLLTIQTGEVGLTSIVPKELAGSNCHALIISRFKKEKVDPKFYSYYFNSSIGRRRLKDFEVGTTMKHLNIGDMFFWKVPFPTSKSEQTNIATVLSDTDTLIEHLGKLIAKKKAIKKGTMQQLLTGKKRLPGFKKEWKINRLVDIADSIKGRGLSKTKLSISGTKKCILYGELFTTYSRIIKDVVSRTDCNDGVPSKFGDVLMPGSTTTIGIDLAIAAALLEDGILLGGDINIIRKKTEKYIPEFLAYYLTQVEKNKISEIAQGITVIHLYGRDLLELEVKIPTDIVEQTNIVRIVTDMDEEIAVLEQRRDKYKMIKQGMMQQLLTGNIRLL